MSDLERAILAEAQRRYNEWHATAPPDEISGAIRMLHYIAEVEEDFAHGDSDLRHNCQKKWEKKHRCRYVAGHSGPHICSCGNYAHETAADGSECSTSHNYLKRVEADRREADENGRTVAQKALAGLGVYTATTYVQQGHLAEFRKYGNKRRPWTSAERDRDYQAHRIFYSDASR